MLSNRRDRAASNGATAVGVSSAAPLIQGIAKRAIEGTAASDEAAELSRQANLRVFCRDLQGSCRTNRLPGEMSRSALYVTAILFTIGKSLIGLYIGSSGVASSYGAAGALLVLLLWVYYSAQIFLLGAEYTRAYAKTHASRP